MRTLFILAVMLLLVSCGGTTGNSVKSVVEILRIDPSCPDDDAELTKCCADQCIDFCKTAKLPMVKNEKNGISCACWCG